MEITGWVAVGVFAFNINNAPQINVEATDNFYQTKMLCQAQLDRVQERLDTVKAPAGIVLVASGTNCVEVTVKQVEPKPNL